MITTRSWRSALLVALAVAVACAIPGHFAWAQTPPPVPSAAERADQIKVTIIVIFGTFAIIALLLGGLWSLQRNFRRTLQETQANILASSGDAAKRDERLLDTLRLLQMSPFGVPDGTIRAAIALALVAVGLLILLTHKAIGLSGVGEISGLLGTVLGFYFGTRTGEAGAQQQAKQATDEASAANAQAAEAKAKADAAIQSAQNANTQAQEATRTAAATGVAAADPKSDEARKKLVEMRSRLEVNRQITRALQQQQSGASVAADAQSTLSKVDALLQSVDLAIKGKVTGQELLDVVQKTEVLLPQLEQVGMPGVFGDAIATLKGALSSGVQIAAVAGNPAAGIVGGLVLAGLKLREQREQFQKWREAVLLQPYDRAALPIDVTDTTAGVIVEQTELAKTRLANYPPGRIAGATALVTAALERDANNTPLSAATVASALYAKADFKAAFLSEDELVEAIEEVRQSANFKRVLEALPAVVEIPPVNGTPGVSVQLRMLLELVPLLRRDARVATELERIAAVVEILKNQTGFTDNELLPLVQQALRSGEALAESARQTQEPPRQE